MEFCNFICTQVVIGRKAAVQLKRVLYIVQKALEGESFEFFVAVAQ